jgi:delta24-sterol reductase
MEASQRQSQSRDNMERHQRAVSTIAENVRQHFMRRETFRINHGSTNSTRPRPHGRVVDISSLSNVLHVDEERRTALVEPNVPMDRLVETTMLYGLVPPVVMEFPGITAGGGYAGTAGESSSFKHGFFDDTINNVEVVLAKGDVVYASRSENADLFHGAAGAVGTLGITTLLELQLIAAKKFVKTTYFPQRSVTEAIEAVRRETRNSTNDYVDGILFSEDHGVVITGEMTDEKPYTTRLQSFSNPFDPWFYLHVKNKTETYDLPITEYIPLAEYLFRYDRGGFWVGRSAFSYFNFPFNTWTRWFLDDFLHTRMLYRALHASGESNRYIVQDMSLPYANAATFINFTAENLGIWPLWLCPLKREPRPSLHPYTEESDNNTKEMLNIGVWGFGPEAPDAFVAKNRLLEKRLHDLGGRKWLYAHTYYSKDEFWNMYGREWYDKLREKYFATTLPDAYEKVKVDTVGSKKEVSSSTLSSLRSYWPLGGLWGIWSAIRSRDYLIPKSSTWRELKSRKE